jgi:hypothetical protein
MSGDGHLRENYPIHIFSVTNFYPMAIMPKEMYHEQVDQLWPVCNIRRDVLNENKVCGCPVFCA